ncbi:MAG: tRNA 2-thiouridine(34) synthase MnmA [Patescibacteria group bacterium]|nr:tRNA 2-thiouridine(34) synthase MnmA [Patescibacteria group bacterium]
MFAKGNNKKVFVGLSGGVDSAVSAALLQEQGYDVTGVFIRIALQGYPCSAGEDKIDAMRVAAHLKIPFIEIDLSKEYKEEVFRDTIEEFARGRTPNPDALCNQKIKFGHFYDFAMSRSADFVATGHYAQIENGKLFAGADPDKDQSYFLWMVPQEHLQKTLFPVGHLLKPEVRVLATKFGLPNAARKDSQGLCFLGDVSIEDMLRHETLQVKGDVLSEEGEVIGVHEGAGFYTLGQRHGFMLFANTPHTPPHYVIEKDAAFNTITVSTLRTPEDAKKTIVSLGKTNWIGDVAGGAYEARFRYRQKLIPAQLSAAHSSVTLKEPHYVPLGQSLVLYKEERCLGGGVVDNSTLI